MCLHGDGMNTSPWNRKHRDVSPCLWYGHLTVEQKTHGCVYTLVVWTSHSGTKTHGCVCTLVVWTPHRVTENTGMCWWYEQTSRSETENTWLCLHVGGMDITQWNRKHRDVSPCLWYGHLTVEQKTQGCVYTLVVWTSHSGTENTWMCLHGDGMNTSPWNRKHRDVSRCLWY